MCPKCQLSWAKCACDITEPDAPSVPIAEPATHNNPEIPFGQYKGQRAASVTDVRYLDWLLGKAWEPFRTQLSDHLQGRADWLALGEDE
jgi:hypothetical protein